MLSVVPPPFRSSFHRTPRCVETETDLAAFLLAFFLSLLFQFADLAVAFWLLLARCLLQTYIQKRCSFFLITIFEGYLRPLNNQWIFKSIYDPNGFILLLRLPSKILTQMEASRTCILWLSMKAVTEEGMGNGEHDPHFGIISWLISGA